MARHRKARSAGSIRRKTRTRAPKKRVSKRNSTVRINPGPDYHLYWAKVALQTVKRSKGIASPEYVAHTLGMIQAHALSALEELKPGDPRYTEASNLLVESHQSANPKSRSGASRARARKRTSATINPRRHVPKLRGRGRPEKEAYYRFELYGTNGDHLATKSEKTTAKKARVLAGKMRHGTFRRRKIAKVILDGPRSRP